MRLFTTATATLCLVALVHAQGFREFRIPTNSTRAVSAYANLSGSAGDGHRNLQGNTSENYYGQLSVHGYFDYDSEDLGWSIEPLLEASNNGSHSENDYERSSGKENYFYNSIDLWQRLSTSANSIYFPNPSPLGFEVGGFGSVGTSQYWYHRESRYDRYDGYQSNSGLTDIEANRIEYDASVELGAGWGRVRNASGVYWAYEVERKLHELGRLSGDLSPETKRKLAEFAYTSSQYGVQHDRSSKYYWQEVEKIVTSDAAFQGPLDAYALYRLSDYFHSGISHWKGIRGGLYARTGHTNHMAFETRDDFQTSRYDTTIYHDTTSFGSNTITERSDELLIGPGVQGYFPLSYSWQINLDSRLERRVLPSDDGFGFSSYLSVEHLLFDRLSVRYAVEHLRWLADSKDRNRSRGSSWAIDNELRAEYYVEDHVNIGCSVNYFQYRFENYVPNLDSQDDPVRFSRGLNYSLNISYRLHGSAGAANSKLPRSSIRRHLTGYPSTVDLPWDLYNSGALPPVPR